MAKKKKQEPIKHKPTKGQLSKWAKQEKRQRITSIIGASVVTVVLLVLGVGFFTQWYIPVYQTSQQEAVKVGEKIYDLGYLVDAVEYYSGGNSQYVPYVVDFATQRIPKDTLLREEAKGMGYSVTDEEVNDYLKENEIESNDFTKDMVEAQLLLDQMQVDYFDPQVPVALEHREFIAMFLESEAKAEEVLEKINNGEEFAALVEEYSLDTYTKNEEGEVEWVCEEILSKRLLSEVAAEYIFSATEGDFSTPVYDETKSKGLGYWLIELLDRDTEEDKVLVKAMVLSSEQEASEICDRLLEGEDFSELAKEYSQLAEVEENGGELDWVERADLGSVFDEFAFSNQTEIGTLSEPLADEGRTTKGGYWLFKVIGVDTDMELSEDDRLTLVNDIISEWVTELEESHSDDIEILIDDEMRAFIVEQAQ